MAATVLYMSISLDGFIAGPDAGPGNGLGHGGERLHEWVLTGADAADGGVPALVSGGINARSSRSSCRQERSSPAAARLSRRRLER